MIFRSVALTVSEPMVQLWASLIPGNSHRVSRFTGKNQTLIINLHWQRPRLRILGTFNLLRMQWIAAWNMTEFVFDIRIRLLPYLDNQLL
jgi:hypothetical protein